MTTIAYKDDVIAFDPYLTQGDRIADNDFCKYQKHDEVGFIFAGSACDYQRLVNAYFGEKELDIDASAVIIRDGKVFEIGQTTNNEFWVHRAEKPIAMGSGSAYALGAMDAGLSAVDAVKIARNRDVYTGGRIRKVIVK